jgi:hypothetical protein
MCLLELAPASNLPGISAAVRLLRPSWLGFAGLVQSCRAAGRLKRRGGGLRFCASVLCLDAVPIAVQAMFVCRARRGFCRGEVVVEW